MPPIALVPPPPLPAIHLLHTIHVLLHVLHAIELHLELLPPAPARSRPCQPSTSSCTPSSSNPTLFLPFTFRPCPPPTPPPARHSPPARHRPPLPARDVALAHHPTY